MQLTNPLPGMNPVFETQWYDFQTSLICGIADALHQVLPEDFAPRADEEEDLPDCDDDLATNAVDGRGVVAASGSSTRKVLTMELPTRRWMKILDIDRRVTTVIEVLCPSDKHGSGRRRYLQKQQDRLRAGVNLVEIDLLRVGEPECSPEIAMTLTPAHGTRYLVIVTRAHRPSEVEVYDCPLRDPLPTIRVPLRPSDLDVPLALQPLIDRVYRTGRYWQDSHFEVLSPALTTDDAAWVEERLQLAGLKEPH